MIVYRKPLDLTAFSLMLLLCFLWGLQQIAIKMVAADVAPMMQLVVRSALSIACLVLFMGLTGKSLLPARESWKAGCIIGVLFALEFLLIGEGLRLTTASHLVVFLYTAPIFAALGLHWRLPDEQLKPLQWLGICLAFSGILLAFLWPRADALAAGQPQPSLLGDLLALAAGFVWGSTTVVVRSSNLGKISASQTLLYQLVGCFLLLAPLTVLSGQTSVHVTLPVILSLLFQGVVIAFASYLVWFWLLRQYLASRLGVLSFMTPLFGVLMGMWLLNEPLEPGFLLGSLLVMLGILLVSGYEWIRNWVHGHRQGY